LKPRDAGKVSDKERVSLELPHPQSPVPVAKAPAPVEPAPKATTPAPQQPVTGVIIRDDGSIATSLSGDQVSLGEAARQAREKKQQPQQ
jgi:hypothetical protein